MQPTYSLSELRARQVQRASSGPRLRAARLAGVAALALLAQFAVDMPAGHFGPRDTITLFGALYAGLFGVLAAVAAGLHLTDSPWAGRLSFLLYTVNLGLFLPALLTDPVVAGLLVVWHLSLLASNFFSLGLATEPATVRSGFPETQSDRWLIRNGPAVRHLLLVSILITVAVVGFRLSTERAAQAVCLGMNLLTTAAALHFEVLLFRSGRRSVLLLALPILLVPAFLANLPVALALIALHHVAVLLVVTSHGGIAGELAVLLHQRTAALTVLTFVALSLLGTLALSFPVASADGEGILPLDALFTATSATCVTGLIVLDTAVDFSFFGQVVILVLIQVGGLGIMLLSTFATILLGGRLGLRRGQAMAELLELSGPGSVYRLTVFIVSSTLAIELAGALLLLPSFLARGLPLATAAWRALFHSVSAFCNAGFALQSDSLIEFQRDPLALAVVIALITLGGIGFLVVYGVWSWTRRRRMGALALHAKVAGWTSLVLTLAGFMVILFLEWNASLKDLPPAHRLSNALFQSVTLRTAGFNTVDVQGQVPATGLVMQAFMFVGASPGGTGGGIKTTTFVVLLAAVAAIARRRTRVELFRRTISQAIVFRSAAIAIIYAGIAFLTLLVLLATQSQPFDVLAFETLSALGTVGLSQGATSALDPVGRLVLTMAMLVGRSGPLTIALLLGQTRQTHVSYPEAPVMVG